VWKRTRTTCLVGAQIRLGADRAATTGHDDVDDDDENSTCRPEMLFPRRHPRFSLLLALLLFTTLLLLLPHSPLATTFQPQSSSGLGSPSQTPISHVVYQDLAARVRRAERAYQKMLRARDALIAKVGPTPRNVLLFVWSHVASCLNSLTSRHPGFHPTGNRGRDIQFVSPSLFLCGPLQCRLQGTFLHPRFLAHTNWSA